MGKQSFILGLVLGILPVLASAMPMKSQMLKPRAYFIEGEGGLLEALDLKAKTILFSKAEFDRCGAQLMRKAQTLEYTCTLSIPTTKKFSRLQNQVTAKTVDVNFGGSKRKVGFSVSPDAKQLTVTTAFDATGVDFEVSKFNDDFFNVYNKVAQLVMSEAMAKQPLRIEVAESR